MAHTHVKARPLHTWQKRKKSQIDKHTQHQLCKGKVQIYILSFCLVLGTREGRKKIKLHKNSILDPGAWIRFKTDISLISSSTNSGACQKLGEALSKISIWSIPSFSLLLWPFLYCAKWTFSFLGLETSSHMYHFFLDSRIKMKRYSTH